MAIKGFPILPRSPELVRCSLASYPAHHFFAGGQDQRSFDLTDWSDWSSPRICGKYFSYLVTLNRFFGGCCNKILGVFILFIYSFIYLFMFTLQDNKYAYLNIFRILDGATGLSIDLYSTSDVIISFKNSPGILFWLVFFIISYKMVVTSFRSSSFVLMFHWWLWNILPNFWRHHIYFYIVQSNV